MVQRGSDVFKEEVLEWTISQSLEMEHLSPGCWTGMGTGYSFDPNCSSAWRQHWTQNHRMGYRAGEGGYPETVRLGKWAGIAFQGAVSGWPEVKACVCQTRNGCMLELEYHYYETGLSWAMILNGIRNDSLLLRDNQPQQQGWERCQARHTFLGAWCWHSGHLASTLTHPSLREILGTVLPRAGNHLGQEPAPHQSAVLWGPVF